MCFTQKKKKKKIQTGIRQGNTLYPQKSSLTFKHLNWQDKGIHIDDEDHLEDAQVMLEELDQEEIKEEIYYNY